MWEEFIMVKDLKIKLKEKTVDELLELLILGLEYTKLEEENKNNLN